MSRPATRPPHAGAVLALFALLAAATTPARADVQPAPGWQFRVVTEGLPQVDNLAYGPDGAVYATQELDPGRVVRLDRDGATVVLGALQRPDGLLIRGGHLFVTEEIAAGRVMVMGLASGRATTLGNFYKPEGIGMLSDGRLVISEDGSPGRLLRLEPGGGFTVLADGLERPEGLVVAADDTIYIAETAAGRVRVYRDGGLTVLAEGIAWPDQVRLDPDGNLWVTEDQSPGRLLRVGPGGAVAVVATGLDFPQGMLVRDGVLLVAEQGRGRILAFTRAPAAPEAPTERSAP
ncbi:MAG: hypothetical protein HZA24_07845 [Nitrospirae bacterium]|nr:hypothetical protein [Nitrospirota bacterium]